MLKLETRAGIFASSPNLAFVWMGPCSEVTWLRLQTKWSLHPNLQKLDSVWVLGSASQPSCFQDSFCKSAQTSKIRRYSISVSYGVISYYGYITHTNTLLHCLGGSEKVKRIHSAKQWKHEKIGLVQCCCRAGITEWVPILIRDMQLQRSSKYEKKTSGYSVLPQRQILEKLCLKHGCMHLSSKGLARAVVHVTSVRSAIKPWVGPSDSSRHSESHGSAVVACLQIDSQRRALPKNVSGRFALKSNS